jgi:hypothetical protein
MPIYVLVSSVAVTRTGRRARLAFLSSYSIQYVIPSQRLCADELKKQLQR